MTTFNDICQRVENAETASELLKQACAMPRTANDKQALPSPSGEAPFDSAWEVLSQAVEIDTEHRSH